MGPWTIDVKSFNYSQLEGENIKSEWLLLTWIIEFRPPLSRALNRDAETSRLVKALHDCLVTKKSAIDEL